MNRSGRRAATWTLLVAAACLCGAASDEAQRGDGAPASEELGGVQGSPPFKQSPQVEIDSFAYRRDIPAGSPGLTELRLDVAALAHTRTGFADLRIVSSDGRQVPFLVEKQAEPLSIQLPALEKDSASFPRRRPPSGGAVGATRGTVSRYAVRLPYPHLPASRLVLTTTARVFERELWVEVGPGEHDDRPDADWRVVATSWWSHADPETAAPALTFDVPPLHTTTLHLAVDEGDNSPLPLAHPALLLPAYRLRFVRATAAPLQLIYGNRQVEQPRYDLALVARRLLDSPAAQVTAGPERPATAPRVRAGIVFWSALGLAVAVLFGLIVRLLRRQSPP